MLRSIVHHLELSMESICFQLRLNIRKQKYYSRKILVLPILARRDDLYLKCVGELF